MREAASVILLRRTPRGASPYEVFFVRRHKGSSFMASAYVFPGGAADPGEDARTAAVRELFEEAGVLLARDSGAQAETLEVPNQEQLRKQVLGGVAAKDALARAGLTWATDALVPWSHWITPSVEKKRFSARFFVTELPAGQEPRFDEAETVDQAWVAPAQALARAAELMLPPPQIRTCWELAQWTSIEAVLAAGRSRAEEPHPIMPRLMPGDRPCLVLPWDADYIQATGDSAAMAYRPRWATGPSRFVLEDGAWRHVDGPGSTTAA